MYEKKYWKIINAYESKMPHELLTRCLSKLGTQYLSLERATLWDFQEGSWRFFRNFPLIQNNLKYLSLRNSGNRECSIENIAFGSTGLEKLSLGGKGVSNLKPCMDYCEDPAKMFENLIICFPTQTELFHLLRSQCRLGCPRLW